MRLSTKTIPMWGTIAIGVLTAVTSLFGSKWTADATASNRISEVSERVVRVETKTDIVDKRIDRLETKIDWLIQKQGGSPTVINQQAKQAND